MNVKVYTDSEGKPQHLAVLNEKNNEFHSLCGSPPGGMEVKESEAKQVKVTCKSCDQQLKLIQDM